MNYRKHILGTNISLHLNRKWVSVGISLRRYDEEGTFSLRLPFVQLYVSRDAWNYYNPASPCDTWELSLDVHNWTIWWLGGHLPGGNDFPRTLHIPHLKWRCEKANANEQDQGEHRYTYQWKYQPEVVQSVMARVTTSTRIERLMFGDLKLPYTRTRGQIWVDFSEEMGDQRGSWKGGVMGAGDEIEPGLSWVHAFVDMQKKRNFCRGK